MNLPGSVRKVIKAWERCLDSSEGYLESNEGDPELIVFIPFISDVKIRSISIVGGADGTSPSKMRVFINRDGIDFSDAQSTQAVQEWDLVENMQGMLEYQTKYSRFQNVANITLHFPDSFGVDTTQIHYIGFKGEATQLKRDAVVNIVYELMPSPSDHKTRAETGGGFSPVEWEKTYGPFLFVGIVRPVEHFVFPYMHLFVAVFTVITASGREGLLGALLTSMGKVPYPPPLAYAASCFLLEITVKAACCECDSFSNGCFNCNF